MKKIIVDFGDLVEEMKEKQIKLCLLLRKGTGWFVIDNQNRFYQIESYYHGGYLDKYIINKTKIEFNLIPTSISDKIEDWERKIWDVEKVKAFINRQSKYWI